MKSEKYNILLQKYVQERLGSVVVSEANYIETAKSQCAEHICCPTGFCQTYLVFLPFSPLSVWDIKSGWIQNNRGKELTVCIKR